MLRRDENHFWAEKKCGGRFGADFEKKLTPHPYIHYHRGTSLPSQVVTAVTNSFSTQTG